MEEPLYFIIDKDAGVESVSVKFADIADGEDGDFIESTAVYLTETGLWPGNEWYYYKINEIVVRLHEGCSFKELSFGGREIRFYTSKQETERYCRYYWTADVATAPEYGLRIRTDKPSRMLRLNYDEDAVRVRVWDDVYGDTTLAPSYIDGYEFVYGRDYNLYVTINAKSSYNIDNVTFSGCNVLKTFIDSNKEIKKLIQVLDHDVTISVEASPISGTLSINASPESIIIVERISSKVGASIGYLQDGDTLYCEDDLHIVIDVKPGYDITTDVTLYYINGETTYTSVGPDEYYSLGVPVSVSITATTTPKSYKLSRRNEYPYLAISVERISSPLAGASIGMLDIDSTPVIYYADVLKINIVMLIEEYIVNKFTISDEYENSITVNYGDLYTVGIYEGENVYISVSLMRGLIYIDNGAQFDKYLIYIDNGSSWDQYIAYIDNGASWDLCG